MTHEEVVNGRFALSAARLFDGHSTRADHAVVIEGDTVTEVVPRLALPVSIVCHHEPDCTILPGLIDTHVHFMRWQGPRYLAFGVTTVRDTGSDLDWILARREEWTENPWPRILSLGPLIDGKPPYHEFVSRGCADALEGVTAVRETADRGVDGIKFYTNLEPEWLPGMVREAHASGLKASMHCLSGGVVSAARAGVDEVYHLDGVLADVWPDHPPGWLFLWGLPEFAATLDRQRRLADQIRAAGMTATPTLAYWDSQWRVRSEQGIATDHGLIPSPLTEWQVPPPDLPMSEQWRRALQAAQGFVGLLLERGVPILAGTDVPFGPMVPGLSLWDELILLAEAGLSAEEAIRGATSEAGSFMNRPELGTLAPGSAADVVVVRGNPLEAIPERPDISRVVVSGQCLDPQDLLGTADSDPSVLADEPWARQLERHWERRQD